MNRASGPTLPLNLRIPPALKRAIERQAERENLSLNAFMVRELKAMVDARESDARDRS